MMAAVAAGTINAGMGINTTTKVKRCQTHSTSPLLNKLPVRVQVPLLNCADDGAPDGAVLCLAAWRFILHIHPITIKPIL
jgi:hypothetical protein